MKPLFTAAELAAIAAADAELDAKPLTQQELKEADARDKQVKRGRTLTEAQRLAKNERERKRYWANREKRLEYARRWRKKNPNASRKYYEANADARRAYQREYGTRKRAERKAAETI